MCGIFSGFITWAASKDVKFIGAAANSETQTNLALDWLQPNPESAACLTGALSEPKGSGRSLMEFAMSHAQNSAIVSVIIPTLNNRDTIGAQLEALSRQKYSGDLEIIVADNGSSDGTQEVIFSWASRLTNLRIIDASDMPGANYARNAGVRESRGSLLLLCDGDDIADLSWVDEMVRALYLYDLVGGFLERTKLNDKVALAARPLKHKAGLLNSFGFLPYSPFANAGMRRDVWIKAGFFDVSYVYGSDDVDFFWRSQLQGVKIGFAPKALMHYRLRSDLGGIFRQAYRYGCSHPKLFKAYRSFGMPQSDPRQAGIEWLWIVIHLSWLIDRKPRRAEWLYRFGLRLGRLSSSLRHRIPYL